MLWSGANVYDGDTITLSQPVTNFTWLLFMFRTNSEVSTVLFKADHATNDRPYANIQYSRHIAISRVKTTEPLQKRRRYDLLLSP